MNTPRRAASGAITLTLRLLTGLLLGVSALLAGAWLLAIATARRVVAPRARVPDTRILDIDQRAQTITLSRTPDTELPGRYGMLTSGSLDYVKLGSVLSSDEGSVTRKLLTHVDGDDRISSEAAFSSWYYDRPEQLQLPFHSELIGSAVGPCPAWLFPGEEGSSGEDWAIQVHGWGTRRAECLRAVPVFEALGFTSLVVSYRNDGEAPRSRSGTSSLGATEWRDVDAAVAFALRRGAKRIWLMGWSMGGAVVMQLATRSAHRDRIAGIVLDSPVIDWRGVLGFQTRLNRIPDPIGRLAVATLGSEVASRATGVEQAIPFDRLDIVAQAAQLRIPMLILHSDDDGFVPSDGSRALAETRPELVTLESFEVARHVKMWNYDSERWEKAISRWVTARRGQLGE